MSCDVGKATEGLENELWCRWSNGKVREWATSQFILQHFFRFSYDTSSSLISPGEPPMFSWILLIAYSRLNPIRDGPPPWGLVEVLATSHSKKYIDTKSIHKSRNWTNSLAWSWQRNTCFTLDSISIIMKTYSKARNHCFIFVKFAAGDLIDTSLRFMLWLTAQLLMIAGRPRCPLGS